MSWRTPRARRRRRPQAVAAVIATLALAAGCGGSDSSPGDGAAATQPASTRSSSSADAPPPPPVVGLWTQTHTCPQLIAALADAGLAEAAPATIGDYFPDESPKQLAAKADPCSGATPQKHSHFFTEDGEFGSVDAEGNQVDNGTWRLVDDDTIRIGSGRFDFQVSDGTLVLHPVVTASDRAAALRKPLDFSNAVWEVSVGYGGRPWRSAPCRTWC